LMPKKRRILEKENGLSMKKCKAVRTILDDAIKKLPLREQKELSEFVKGKEELLRTKGKELNPATRHSIIVSWFVKKGKRLL